MTRTATAVSTIDEEELVFQSQQGDRSAYGELVRFHASGVLNVVYRLCGDAQLAEDAAPETQGRVRRYAHSDAAEIHWDIIRLALSSIAATAIIPMQDILGFGGDCRMNLPGTVDGNWLWRCAARFMSPEVAERLRQETAFYGRGE